MITLSSTTISSKLFQVWVGGDVAALKGIMKILVEADEAARAAEQPEILDWDFIRGHTVGIEALADDLKARNGPTSSANRVDARGSGICGQGLHEIERAIFVYGMGSRNTLAAPTTSSRWRIRRCCAEASGAKERVCARFAAIPTSRATDGRHYRGAQRGTARASGAAVRLQATGSARAQRRNGSRSDDPRRGQGLLRDGRKLCRRHSRLAVDAGGAVQSRSDRSRLDQA